MAKQTIRENGAFRLFMALLGCFIYAVGMNFFIIPQNTYSGGLMGVCQLIGTMITRFLGISFGNFDFTGLVYYIINVPIFIWAYKSVGLKFVSKTLVCVTALSLMLSLIPVLPTPVMEGDILANCIIGGIITGAGIGITLSNGSSMGGLDIIGLILTKKKQSDSIGHLYLIVNAVLYFVCFFMFNVETVIYSMIIAFIASFMMDKVHVQNINCEVKVITKHLNKDMQEEILNDMYRGITRLDCKGAYTEDDEYIFYILMSKFEIERLKAIVHKYDPHAWVIVNEKVSVHGAFIKKL